MAKIDAGRREKSLRTHALTHLRSGVAVLGVAALAACSNGEAKESAPAAAKAPAGRLVSVETVVVRPESFTDFLQVVGRVEANQDVTVSAEESGVVVQLLAEKGAYVRAGQPIARIDDRMLRAQADQAAAEAALARETWERQRKLWEEDRIGSEMQYLQAKYGAQTAEAGSRALRERLARTTVRAPIAGILDARMVEVGTMLMAGTPVARIVDVGTVKVTGGVPERFAGEVRTGAPARVTLDGALGREFEGKISFVGASVSEQSRTFPVEVRIPNEQSVLKPGMIANVRVARGAADSAVVIPQEAVVRVEDGYAVYVAAQRGEEWTAEIRPVALGAAQSNRVVVQSGVQPGDRLIVVGQNKVSAGDRLRLVGEGGEG